jgi:Mg-chelatase subunit ChlD
MYKKIIFLMLLITTVAFTKEIIVVIDRSSMDKMPNKQIEKNINQIFKFKKKNPDKYFLQDGDIISSYTINSDITKLSPTVFNDYEFENLKKIRKEMFKKSFKTKINDKTKRYRGKVNFLKSELYKNKIIPNNSIVLCIDVSGSMLKDHKKNANDAKNAALDIIRLINPKFTKVSIVKFGYNAEVIQDFTNDKELLNSQINKVIKGIKNNTPTNTKDGIEKSLSLLSDKNGNKKIILLSDGSPQVYDKNKKLIDITSETIDSSKKASKLKVEIMTVALVGANTNTLDKISTIGTSLLTSSYNFKKQLQLSMLNNSPIIDSLKYIYENENINNKEDHRVLIIFSNMMEKTKTFNFNTVSELDNKEFIEKVIKNYELPDMTGVEVYVTGFSKKSSPEHLEKLKVFWKNFFESTNAKLISFSPVFTLKTN